MGKYQLDANGHASVNKFHEKHSTEGAKGINTKNATQAKIAALREKHLQTKGKKSNDKKA